MIPPTPQITIRDLHTIDDLLQLKSVEKQVWGMTDEDALPLTLAIALKTAGNVFLGAFDQGKPAISAGREKPEKEQLVGFAFGFLGFEQGVTTVHSHMLAVIEGYRHLDLGARLKQAQRERALAMGVREVTWTFDPLQSRNAHFNFAKLGVLSDTYKIDFYGPETSSVLHRNGTDRLWVRWLLESKRVRDRLAGKNAEGKNVEGKNADVTNAGGKNAAVTNGRMETLDALRLRAPLVRFNGNGRPERAELAESLSRQRVSIEIPGDILAVERADMGLAREWRAATRWAFLESLNAGFVVTEYCRSVRGQQGPGAYLLEQTTVADAAER